ncbi:nucleolar complex protein 14, partial [Rhizopus azygosporus]
KQIGEENRKKTLLLEMKNKNRRGGIIDKRFGENNPHLTPEEKMLERFTREKQKTVRTSMFNLEDDEDISLTHYGQSLSTMDDFDDAGLGLSDEDENGQMDKNVVSKLHFGGFDDEEEEPEHKHKSKHEVMKEIIAKSKMYKAERQAAKAEDEELRETLDDELKDIRGLLETKPARKPLPSQTSLFKKAEGENNNKDLEDYSDYDTALLELATDRRAMATDRTKTEEEIALEEKEKLEKAERARKRRMEGLDSEDEEEVDKKGRKKRKNAPQGDDLEDDYLEDLEDEAGRLGKGLTLEGIQNGEMDEDEEEEDEDGDEDEDEDEDEEDEEGEEETDNEDIEGSDNEVPDFGDDDGDDMNEFGQTGAIKKKPSVQSNKQSTANGKREIPYTFECPESHDAFLSILEGLDVQDVLVVTQRIRVLYHIKLHPENKQKLSIFLGVLVDHVAYLASTVSPLPREVLEKLSVHIFELSQQVPEAAADLFTDKLRKMQAEMGKKIKFDNGSSWPDVEDLIYLRTIGQIFSTSDLQHPIGTPATLFMCHALAQCKVQTEIDMGRGLFLTQILYEYQKVSKRYVPEVLNFFSKNLVMLAPKDTFASDFPGLFPLDKLGQMPIKNIKGNDIEHIPNVTLDELSTETESDDHYRLSLVQATLRQLEKYLQLYASTAAFKEVFEGTLDVIERLNSLEWHKDIKNLLDTLKGRLERQIKFCIEKRTKTPLRLQQHRPIPIAQHLPKFEKAYSMDRHYDPDQARAQLRKLESQVKKEKKGAMRELRKDNQFIAREKVKERKAKDAEYNKMINSVMHILEGEQSEKKQLEREKKKK